MFECSPRLQLQWADQHGVCCGCRCRTEAMGHANPKVKEDTYKWLTEAIKQVRGRTGQDLK